MRVILVPVADRPECTLAMKTAFHTAETLGANVVGCHIRSHRLEPASRGIGELLMPDTADMRSETGDGDLDSKRAAAAFEKAADRNGFALKKRPTLKGRREAVWEEMVGSPARVFSIVGPMADLSVVSRPKANSYGRARTFLLAALVHSGKPVLVLPQKAIRAPGKRVLIAWNQSIEAARAVAASLPVLAGAEAVHIVSCGKENLPGPKSKYLAEYLTHWGIKSTRHSTKGIDIEAELAETYADVDADLVVMGAYSRHKLRELIFGGVTNTMLFKTQLPVLVLHA